MTWLQVCPLLTAVALAGCASTRPEPTIHASLVLWSKGDEAACQFDLPRRDAALAVSYSQTMQAVRSRRTPPLQSYAVRNAQLRERPHAEDVLCLALIRGRALDRADVVIGFEVRPVSETDLEILPVSGQVFRAVRGRASSISMTVGFATGLLQSGGVRLASSALFDLGRLPVDGSLVQWTGAAQRLAWPPPTGDHDILRIGALAVESSGGAPESISEAELSATISAPR